MQRKTLKGKAKDDAASASQGPASASQAPAAASQDPAGISQGTASASQVTAAASQAPASASQAPASASQDPAGVSQGTASASQVVDGSQVIDAEAEASQDLFGDIPDEVMASIPEVMPVKPKKQKLKVAHHQPLYHGQRRRTSERIKMNSFKTPLTGIGSSDKQPIQIKDNDV
jgi:hypothetical protein